MTAEKKIAQKRLTLVWHLFTDEYVLSIVHFRFSRGGLRDALATSRLGKIHRVAFIIVDAETDVKPSWGILGEIPGLGAIKDASSTILINKCNFETLDLLRWNIEAWKRESEAALNPIDFYLVHLTFNSLPEVAERDYSHSIPTSLSLPAEQVDRIREAAARLIIHLPSSGGWSRI